MLLALWTIPSNTEPTTIPIKEHFSHNKSGSNCESEVVGSFAQSDGEQQLNQEVKEKELRSEGSQQSVERHTIFTERSKDWDEAELNAFLKERIEAARRRNPIPPIA